MEEGWAVCSGIMIFYFSPLNAELIFFQMHKKEKKKKELLPLAYNSQTKEAEADTPDNG